MSKDNRLCEICGGKLKRTQKKYCCKKCYTAGQRAASENALRVERMRVKELEKEIAQLHRGSAKRADLIQAIESAVKVLPPLEVGELVIEPKESDLDSEDVVAVISDVHIGSFVDPGLLGGLGGYSMGIFMKRVERYADRLLGILRYSPNKIDKLHLVFLGDVVDGATIFKGHSGRIDTIVVKQIMAGYEQFGRLIAKLAPHFPEIVVSGVPGNHGRIGMKGELVASDNFDSLLYYFLKERCNGIPNVRFNLTDSWWMVLKVRGWKFLLTHGDDVRAWMGIPYYGATRYKAKMREMFRELFMREGEEFPDFDAILMGHHHKAAVFDSVFMNGAWPGASEFSAKRLQAGSLPAQLVLGIHDNHCPSWWRALYLESNKERPEMPVFE